MPQRVLIVSPHFPPVNAPDHQRVRMSLPYLADFGWEAHVLAVAPEFVETGRDPDLLRTIPDYTRITRVSAVPAKFTRPIGLGSLALRAFLALHRSGTRLLQRQHFDLVYFSTTMFVSMALGPLWKRRFGVPYVLDMQDPWLSDYYHTTGVSPPGGWFKHGFAQWQARCLEPCTMRRATHIISVSPAYPAMLQSRYPDLRSDRFSILPFGASELDMQTVSRESIRQSVFSPDDGFIHWTYLGRGGADMAKGLRGLFLALRSLRETHPRAERLKLHFVGTSYAPEGKAEKTVEPLARELGVADLVSEQTARIPYLQGLALLRDSAAVLVVGSDDPMYSASKVYPCILSQRPLFAVLHETSLAGEVIRRCQAGEVVGFRSAEGSEELAKRIYPVLSRLLDLPPGTASHLDWSAFAPYTAKEMTRQQCAVFSRVASHSPAYRNCPMQGENP